MGANRPDSPECGYASWAGKSPLHSPVAGQNGDHHRSCRWQLLAGPLRVQGQRVGYPRVAVRWMNLEIADVTGAHLPPVDERRSLTDRDAANDGPVALGDADPPALSFQAIQREEIRTTIDSHGDVAYHRAGRRQRNQLLIIGRSRLAYVKVEDSIRRCLRSA